MKTVHTLKRVTFKEGSNSEVVVISAMGLHDHSPKYNFALMHSTLTDILEEYKRLVVKNRRPYIIDFQLFRLNGELETKLLMTLSNENGDRVRFNIHRVCIGLDGVYTSENITFCWEVDHPDCIPEMVNFINTYIRRL